MIVVIQRLYETSQLCITLDKQNPGLRLRYDFSGGGGVLAKALSSLWNAVSCHQKLELSLSLFTVWFIFWLCC